MSEQLYSQAVNLIDTYAQKQHLKGLCEFEYRLYEKLCEAMSIYFGGLGYAFQISAMKTEVECANEEIIYLKWVAEQEQARIDAEKEEKKKGEGEEPTEV